MARSADDPRLCFKAYYHDELSGLTREFQLRFYFQDKSVELTDLNTKKVFLKRTESPNLETSDFVLGKTVVVFGRLLHLVEYLDLVTRQLCEGVSCSSAAPGGSLVAAASSSSSTSSSSFLPPINQQRSSQLSGSGGGGGNVHQQQQRCGTCYVFVEKSAFFKVIGKVLSVLDVELGFTMTGITAGTLPTVAASQAATMLANASDGGGAQGGEAAVANIRALSGKMLCCFRLAKASCETLVPEIYRRLVPPSAAGAGGFSSALPLPAASRVGLFAAAVGSTDSPYESLFEAIAGRAASKYVSGTAAVGSVVIVKPHLLVNKSAGDVIQLILQQCGGELAGMCLINLSARDATQMMAPYRGVLTDFHGTTTQLSSGACIAVHVCSKGTAAVLAAEDAYRDQCAEEVEAAESLSRGGPAQQSLNSGRGAANTNTASSSSSSSSSSNEAADHEVFLAVRALCGPFDPTIAKALRSSTIRARYGVDKAMNAVHCCDIEEDVAGICRFLFALVAVRKLLKPSSECS